MKKKYTAILVLVSIFLSCGITLLLDRTLNPEPKPIYPKPITNIDNIYWFTFETDKGYMQLHTIVDMENETAVITWFGHWYPPIQSITISEPYFESGNL